MAEKFYGKVGYAVEIETGPGVIGEDIVVKKYYGEITRNSRRMESSDKGNDNIIINNAIDIMADAYAYSHFYAIRWVEWQGQKWKVNYAEVKRPVISLTLGGLYNEHDRRATT
jgi:hypothetical protein